MKFRWNCNIILKCVRNTSLKEWLNAIAGFWYDLRDRLSTRSRIDLESCVNRNGGQLLIQED